MRAAAPARAVLLAAALAGSACATSRVGEAEVRLVQGQPCFGVTADEARHAGALNVHAVELWDVSASSARRVWESSAEDEARTRTLQDRQCIRLDERPAGYRTSAAVQLEPARVYEVTMNLVPVRGRRTRHGYTARFCLQVAGGGAARLVALAPNAEACPR